MPGMPRFCGWLSGSAPRAISVVTTGIPVSSASVSNSWEAPERTIPPPTYSTGRLALTIILAAFDLLAVRRWRAVAGQVDRVGPFEGCLGGQGVLLMSTGPAPAARCPPGGTPGDRAGSPRIGDEVVVFDNRHGDAGDVSFLEGVRADRGTRHLAGDRDDRDRVHVGIGDGVTRLVARSRGRHADPDFAGCLRVSLGGVAGALFMAHQDVAYLVGVHRGS